MYCEKELEPLDRRALERLQATLARAAPSPHYAAIAELPASKLASVGLEMHPDQQVCGA